MRIKNVVKVMNFHSLLRVDKSKKQAEKLYRDIRFYTHGLACQIACNSILITEEEIKKYIKETIEKLK